MWNNKYFWYRVIYKFYIVLTSAGDIDNGLSQLGDIKKAIINFKSQLKMKAILALLLFAFAYSLPNPVYMIKDCFEKLYDVKSNDVLQRSVTNKLLNWKADEFYTKVNNVDPTLKQKIEECFEQTSKKYQRQRIIVPQN